VKESKEAREAKIARIKEHQFPRGQSPNPGGRTKGTSWTKLLREIGNELNPKDKTGATYRESAIRILWHKVANEGSIRGAELIAEREDGKVPQQIAMSGTVETVAREERVAQVLERLAALKGVDDHRPVN
jgi:hypothetical protein